MPDHSMASSVANLTTVDVYELAAKIGNQFEKMIDRLGTDSISELMPMVIRALEHLEEMTSKVECENAEISELKFTVERLQMEKKLKAEEKMKFEMELEQIEERWKKDAQNQHDIIVKLQDENQKLNSLIVQNKINESLNIELIDEHAELQEEIERLKLIIQKQREELRKLDKNLDEQTNNAEMLESKIKHLFRQSSENHRKTSQMERLAQNTIFEKSLLLTQLNDKDRMLRFLQEKIKRLEEAVSLQDQPEDELARKNFLDHQGILEERDALLVRVEALQQELNLCKLQRNNDINNNNISSSNNDDDDDDDDEDAPVQGPINKEPDEKLYPEKFKKESGIRRFFKNLLTPLKTSSSASSLASRPSSSSSSLRERNKMMISSSSSLSSPHSQLTQSLSTNRRNSIQTSSSSLLHSQHKRNPF